MSRRRLARVCQIVAIVAATATAAAGAAGCASQHGGTGSQPGPARTLPPPVPEPLAPIGDYRDAVTVALRDHLRVWIEADMVKRWEEGPRWFHAAVDRVSALASRPGVVGIKIADELGYNDGMDSPGKIRHFLADTARALHASAPHKLILVDMVLPQLGCIPGHQPAGSPEAGCAAQAQSAYPQLALSAVDGYLHMHAIDVLDLSTGLLTDGTYTKWGTTSDEAQTAAWQEVSRRGWPQMVQLQGRKALAHPGSYPGKQAQAAADVHLFVDIPLANGAGAIDVWTWNQIYNGALYHLMNPGMRPNVLWKQLERRRHSGDVLFTHMSPHSVELGLKPDLAMIATVFTDIFLPAGTG
jgi:hypothetical protein